MDSITAILTIRDNLRNNLTDAFVTAGGQTRGGSMWIFADEPNAGAQYPRVQILKVDNPSRPITIGSAYTEFEELYLTIWFQTKNGFKITVSGTEYTNNALVEYYQGLIKTTLKAQFDTLFTAGVLGYKHINTSKPTYDQSTQLFFGNVTIRVFYFNS